jgi:hypothetical protein
LELLGYRDACAHSTVVATVETSIMEIAALLSFGEFR